MREHAHATELATRIEIAETAVEAGAYEEYLSRHPDDDGAVIRRGHATVIHGGTPDKITRLWGFSLGGAPEVDLLDDAIAEARRRGQRKVSYEWNPYTSDTLFDVLGDRGFVVQEFTNTYRLGEPATPTRPLGEGLRIVHLDVNDASMVDAAARTWVIGMGMEDLPEPYMYVARMLLSYSRRLTVMAKDGDLVAGMGTLCMHEGLGFLGAAGTRPEYRGRGIQSHLLSERIGHALAHDCDMVTIGSDPGTTSQRNIERSGFTCLYTKLTVKLMLT